MKLLDKLKSLIGLGGSETLQTDSAGTPEQNEAEEAEGMEAPVHVVTRETLESIIVAFVLAFVFRTYVLEPFIIPTGSMAPTLLGRHHGIECPECGYTFDVSRTDDLSREMVGMQCPMCLNESLSTDRKFRSQSGDRILVNKFAYHIAEPKRWDVVVFKAPHKPYINFIKRLVGLPGEQLMVVNGNIYVKPEGQDWQIARKPDPAVNPHAHTIQNAVWQPIYHSNYVPKNPDLVLKWQAPWKVSGAYPATKTNWQLKDRRDYVYTGAEPTEIDFDFRTDSTMRLPWFSYNLSGSAMDSEYLPDGFLEEIRLKCDVKASKPTGVTLKTTGYVTDNPLAGRSDLMARISSDGTVKLLSSYDGEEQVIAEDKISWRAGRSYELELWWVDQQLSLWVDGEKILFWNMELSMPTLTNLRRSGLPEISMQVAPEAEGTVTFEDVQVDRDLIYTTTGGSKRQGVYVGGVEKPVTLKDGQYFCMGDNSPNSSDSRDWGTVDTWLETSYEAQTELELTPGVVPAHLMMGKAFSVYFPGPRPGGIIPFNLNWGDVRLIR